jgi:hypothetical protein
VPLVVVELLVVDVVEPELVVQQPPPVPALEEVLPELPPAPDPVTVEPTVTEPLPVPPTVTVLPVVP